jgi:hypothetical protein
VLRMVRFGWPAVANALAGLMKSFSLVSFHHLRPSSKPVRVGLRLHQ